MPSAPNHLSPGDTLGDGPEGAFAQLIRLRPPLKVLQHVAARQELPIALLPRCVFRHLSTGVGQAAGGGRGGPNSGCDTREGELATG